MSRDRESPIEGADDPNPEATAADSGSTTLDSETTVPTSRPTAADRNGDASSGRRSQSPLDDPVIHPRDSDPTILGATGSRLRDDPRLWLPFFLAGCLALVADLLREHDPLPATTGLEGSTLHASYAIYPTGTFVTERPLGALVDLQPPLLGYALGLELIVLAAIVVAGWETMRRATDVPFHRRRFLVYASGVGFLTVFVEVAAAMGLEYSTDRLLVGLALLAGLLFVAVRLFLVPVTLLREGGVLQPVSVSWRSSRGYGTAIAGIVLLVGIGSWALAHVPVIGSLCSTTVAGTVHAVSLVVVYERCVNA